MILHCLANTIILVQYNFTSVYVQPSSSLCWLFYQTLYLEVPKSPNLMLRIGYDSFPLLPMIPGSNFMARARLTLVEAFHGIKPTIWMIYIMGRRRTIFHRDIMKNEMVTFFSGYPVYTPIFYGCHRMV